MPGLGGPSRHESAVEREVHGTLKNHVGTRRTANYAVEARSARPRTALGKRTGVRKGDNVCLAGNALKKLSNRHIFSLQIPSHINDSSCVVENLFFEC